MVERQSCKLKVLGSIPSGGLFKKAVFHKRLCVDVCPIAAAQDSLAERSKAVAQGAIPQGRGFEPHSCHLAAVLAAASHNNQTYTWPGSNWRPSACEADVIATRPQVLVEKSRRALFKHIPPANLFDDPILLLRLLLHSSRWSVCPSG